jgi:hypothetical protein
MNQVEELSQSTGSYELPQLATDSAHERLLSDMLELLYRRPLLQILLARKVAPDAAQSLIDIACNQTSHEICLRHLNTQAGVQEYLHRLMCGLALSYWHTESRRNPAEHEARTRY